MIYIYMSDFELGLAALLAFCHRPWDPNLHQVFRASSVAKFLRQQRFAIVFTPCHQCSLVKDVTWPP